MFQTMLLQPGLQFAVGLEPLLQGFERVKPGRHVRLARRLGIGLLLLGATGLVQLRHRGLQLLKTGMCHLGRFAGRLKLALQMGQARVVGRGQATAISMESLAAGQQLAVLFRHAPLFGSQNAQGLLHLAHAVALGMGLRQGTLNRLFQIRELLRLVFQLGLEERNLLYSRQGLFSQTLGFGKRFILALRPLGALLRQGDQALLHALATLHHKPDFGL